MEGMRTGETVRETKERECGGKRGEERSPGTSSLGSFIGPLCACTFSAIL